MRSGFKIIDGDGHMQEPLNIWECYLEPEHRERIKVVGAIGRIFHEIAPCEAVPEGTIGNRPQSAFADVQKRYGEAYESWWSLDTRLHDMDSEGIDIMVGFPTNGFLATRPSIVDSNFQAALTRAYNRWAADYCRGAPERVKFVAMVSLLDVPAAVAEIERVAGVPGIAAVMLPDRGGDLMWNDPALDPVWSALVHADLAACFHGGTSQFSMFGPWTRGGLAAVSHSLSFPVDAMIAMGSMIFGGILERHPTLRVGFYEANAGWLPWWLGRMDDHAVGRQSGFSYGSSLTKSPTEYFREQCFIAADVDEPRLLEVVDVLKGDNIVFNTDYPHPDAPYPGAVDTFLSRGLRDNEAEKILWSNPVRLYGERVLGSPSP